MDWQCANGPHGVPAVTWPGRNTQGAGPCGQHAHGSTQVERTRSILASCGVGQGEGTEVRGVLGVLGCRNGSRRNTGAEVKDAQVPGPASRGKWLTWRG